MTAASTPREVIAGEIAHWLDVGFHYTAENAPPGFRTGDPVTDADDAAMLSDAILSVLSEAGIEVTRLEAVASAGSLIVCPDDLDAEETLYRKEEA